MEFSKYCKDAARSVLCLNEQYYSFENFSKNKMKRHMPVKILHVA